MMDCGSWVFLWADIGFSRALSVSQPCSANRDESLENWEVPTASILLNTQQNQLMPKMPLLIQQLFQVILLFRNLGHDYQFLSNNCSSG